MKYKSYIFLLFLSVLPLTFTACESEPAQIDITLESDYSGMLAAIRGVDKTLSEKLALIESAYRNDPDGMKFCWIDVASCRRSAIATSQIATDMFHLFRYLKTTPENRRALEALYLESASVPRTTADELFEAVENRIKDRMKE